MTEQNQKQLGKILWAIADQLRGAMDADDFPDYMLSFLFLRYLSDNYEAAAKKELGSDYPKLDAESRQVPLAVWYADNAADVPEFEKQMGVALEGVNHGMRMLPGLLRRVGLGPEPAVNKNLPALLVGLLNGLEAPVLHLQNQQAAPRVHHHEVRVQMPGPDRHVIPEQIVFVEFLFKAFGESPLAAGHA